MKIRYPGDVIKLLLTFNNSQGQKANPDTVLFSYQCGAAGVISFQWTLAQPGSDIANVGTGVFSLSVSLTQPGTLTAVARGIGNDCNTVIPYERTVTPLPIPLPMPA